jgi:hypothetical protein
MKTGDMVSGENTGSEVLVSLPAKKSRRYRRLKVDNREASNRVDRSHSMSRTWTPPVMVEKA